MIHALKSMLCDRIQQVRVGQSLSDSTAITSGVQQGSVLGPILFNFFINDRTKEVVTPSTPKLYADDLKMYCPAGMEQDIKAFKESLNKVTKWAETWQLPISKKSLSGYSFQIKRRMWHLNPTSNWLGLLFLVREVLDLGVNFISKWQIELFKPYLNNNSKSKPTSFSFK